MTDKDYKIKNQDKTLITRNREGCMSNQEHPYTNHLSQEKSPYLLQHSHNPVDWYPWGDDAFQAAQENDKPIFLSIGYATCHWCHVMERESFENPQIANQMNDTFICIKVDREELPEVDSLYMEFSQSMMSGSAGWPLNVILTPDLRPFFAATYLPPQSRHGMMGLTELIVRIREVWQGEERESVIQQAEKIVEIFSTNVHVKGVALTDKEYAEDMAELLFKMADPVYGGMKGAPKFPIGYQSSFMLRFSALYKESRAHFLVERTLDMMHRGGIYDHLGGGFSRYSVDEHWLTPHFEKMLYDNALLAQCYLEAWQMTKKPLYQKVCQEILDYILNEMTHSDGGFYSAEDAETEGREGYYYTWTFEEVKKLLGPQDSEIFCAFYDITKEGNFEERNILNTRLSLEEFAIQKHLEPQQVEIILEKGRKILLEARKKRTHPFKDDKILSSWNGLMIYSMVEAGCAFNEKKYLDAALKAANFIRSNLWEEGQLLRRWRDGEAHFPAAIDEYAFLIRGVITLFEAGLGSEWLGWAMQMSQILASEFKAEEGAFYQTDGTDPNLLVRRCQFADGAEPSGNAIHCENLLRLYQLTLEPIYLKQAEDILKAVKEYIENYAPGYCYHGMNLLRYYDKHAPTLVIALDDREKDFETLRQSIYGNFLPHKAIIWRRQNDEKLFHLLPFVKEQVPLEGKTTLYICHHGTCKKPLIDPSDIINAIHRL